MNFTREERKILEQAVKRGSELKCPACGSSINAQEVPTPPGVPYVRHRVWLVCPQCKRSASVDK